MTFLILVSILTVSIGVANIALSQLKLGGAQVHSTKAYFAADAGAERFLYEVIKKSYSPWTCNLDDNIDLDNQLCDTNSHTITMTNGAMFDVIYASSTAKVIRSEGKFQETKRNIELEFE